ncbi:prepilin-type N-terminal cleavage/methylation domain-containing protein [Dehalogenimonas sp. THU2]|uniref:prepilin-type N-terminal cleavage/methylation domain-containing protein n=1 Tax=Dehalogenimonas sp. THU2 TaxID=3151121 RepID=UPI003218583B
MIKILLKKGQTGFTFVEVLVAMAILVLITGALSTGIYQIFSVNRITQDETIAIRQVQNLGQWLNQDVLQSQFRDVSVGTGFPLTLQWDYSGQGGNKHIVVYELTETGVILRHDYVDDAVAPLTISVASFISNVTYSSTNELNVTATVGERTAFRLYQITPRVS